ncbi:MAG TPA: alcohol dehydrogenase catalytic domain-containing protein [Steroidobacter sp.]|jgi:(R,R)-butanediol dehydrogenase/meso-butanediol dehydrogenase/diacetyl reductase|nr:alcohol dehydrogenase catalytic domain-containing protein [Steroidobacteraceae bacterium]HLS81444.1 alcohol dehydrogenase catalytic domain-containing protein [Steroidobacter sp.]
MKAAVFQGVGQPLVIEERPEPSPGPDEVVIKVGRAGICGSDLHMTSEPGTTILAGAIIGHELAGEVVALGKGVTSLRIGDRVAPLPFVGCGRCAACGDGRPHHCAQARIDVVTGFAQYSRVGANDCVVLPPELSDEDGALIEPLAVGLQGVRKAQMQIGCRALVLGAGPIGLASAFWARRLGASRVVVAAHSRRRERFAYELGATHFIAQSELADPAAAINDALGGPPEVVFEAVGQPGAIGKAMEYVAPRGVIIGLGFTTGSDVYSCSIALMKEVRLWFSMVYEKRDFQYTAEVMAAGERAPRAMITDTVSLEEMPAKFESLRGHSADCKVMVSPWGSN